MFSWIIGLIRLLFGKEVRCANCNWKIKPTASLLCDDCLERDRQADRCDDCGESLGRCMCAWVSEYSHPMHIIAGIRVFECGICGNDVRKDGSTLNDASISRIGGDSANGYECYHKSCLK